MINRDVVEDILIKIGIPANLNGFDYIADAIEILDKEKNTKTTHLYHEVGKMHDTKWSCVERSIRHAFQVARSKGKLHEDVERYIGYENKTNAASLAKLLLMAKREGDKE